MTGLPRPLIAEAGVDELVVDRFEDDRRAGDVIGSRGTTGARRSGIDTQRSLSIDGGALRIRPLARPGWGRVALSYGPFRWEPGLTLAVFMLNGHNESQTYHIPLPFRQRLRRIVKDLLHRRLRFRVLQDNLAVGWFDRSVPRGVAEGAAFIMRGGGTDGGTLRTRVAGTAVDACARVQNVQNYFVVTLRERGAIYYIGSTPGAIRGAGCPQLRPVGIDSSFSAEGVHAVVTQSVLGEIDFRADSRVYGVRVVRAPELAGSAMVSQRRPLTVRDEAWHVQEGPAGTAARVTHPREPVGLLHLRLEGGSVGVAGAAWGVSQQGAWYVTVGGGECALYRRSEGVTTRVDRVPYPAPARARGREAELQVLDDGDGFRVTLDGRQLFAREHGRMDSLGTGVGVIGDGRRDVLSIEGHPMSVDGRHLLTLGAPWSPTAGETIVRDSFEGAEGDLEGRTPVEGLTWRRVLGDGHVLASPAGVQVDADRARPNPGRTLYVLPWAAGGAADLSVTVVPPGVARGEGHGGRAGLVFWQDEDNYLVVSSWLDDSPAHDGSSVSAFYRVRGHEEPFDAVWSNVGRDISWGAPARLRVACDGDRFCAWVDDRPVLYRALSDVYPETPHLDISKVGLAVNWEYGNDTGSVFRDFLARRLESS